MPVFISLDSVSSVLNRPPVKKYAVIRDKELTPEKVDLKKEMKKMKKEDPDRYAVMSVDPFASPAALDKSPKKKSKDRLNRDKTKRNSKKDRTEKKNKDGKSRAKSSKESIMDGTDDLNPVLNLVFENEYVGLSYIWVRSSETELIITISLVQHQPISNISIFSNSPILEREGRWSMIIPPSTSTISLDLEYTHTTPVKHELTFKLPASIHLNQNDERVSKISSNEFLDLVQSGFPFTRTVSISILPHIQFEQVCNTLQQMRMRQIQCIDGVAVTLFGYTSNPIVGLVKYQPGNLIADFKGYDEEILDGLIALVADIFI